VAEVEISHNNGGAAMPLGGVRDILQERISDSARRKWVAVNEAKLHLRWAVLEVEPLGVRAAGGGGMGKGEGGKGCGDNAVVDVN
jgi:hypothetical protein